MTNRATDHSTSPPPPPRRPRRLGGWLGRLHRDQRGQTLFLGLFYGILLASLTFLIINGGGKANDKIIAQDTADAAAFSGASWYARGLNTISMCNVTQTQLLSVIVLLDSMEVVTPIATQIIDDLVANLGSSPAGRDMPTDRRFVGVVNIDMPAQNWLVMTQASVEQQLMRTMTSMMNRVPMLEYCRYDDGILWQCCYILDELSTQMVQITPEMAQRQAIEIGKKNGTEASFVLPLYPQLPVENINTRYGSNGFNKFRLPMEEGREPNSRGRVYRALQWYQSRRGHRSGGPFQYMREPFVEPVPMGLFELSRFSVLLWQVSEAKLDMLFNEADPDPVYLGPANRIEDYDKLLAYFQQGGTVYRTYWSRLGFSSIDEFGPLSASNFDIRDPLVPLERLWDDGTRNRNRRRPYRGFRPAPPTYTRATTQREGADPRHDLWYLCEQLKTPFAPNLNIYAVHPPRRDDGTPWPYTDSEMFPYYSTAFERFDGADVGTPTVLERGKYLPPKGQWPRLAPILLDRTIGIKTTANIQDYFTFVGFAQLPGGSRMWPKVFRNPLETPTDGKLICYAQAEVFNDTSWDTFTQNWRVRLVKMEDWQWAINQIAGGASGQAVGAGIDSSAVDAARKMLEMYDPQGVKYISH